MTNRNKCILLAFLMNFLVGITTIVIGTSLTSLEGFYNLTVDKVVLLVSFFALGRVLTVNKIAKAVEKYGSIKVIVFGAIVSFIFMFGLVSVKSYYFGMFFALCGGIGQACQDTASPALFAKFSGDKYGFNITLSQALFGIGAFVAPLLIGVVLSFGFSFKYANYLLCLVPVLMLIISINVKEENMVVSEEDEPLYPLNVKSYLVGIGCCCVLIFLFSGLVNAIYSYTMTYSMEIGMKESTAAFVLTMFSIGNMIGGFYFSNLLKKVEEIKLLKFAFFFGAVFMIVPLFIKTVVITFIFFTLTGFMMGPLFGVIIAIGTRIGYTHVSKVSGQLAICSGVGDIIMPILTSLLIGIINVEGIFYLVASMIFVGYLVTLILDKNCIKG